MSDLIGGTGKRDFSPYVGLGVIRPVMANPTNEDYEKIVGRKNPYDLTYELRTINDELMFPVDILVKSEVTGMYHFVRFLISDRPELSASGSILFMNDLGDFTWGKSTEALLANPKMDWFWLSSFRPAAQGARQLFSFLQMLTSYDKKSPNAKWRQDMIDNKCTCEYMFKHMDVSGLNGLLAWASTRDFSLVAMHSVESKVKDDGSNAYYQRIESGTKNTIMFYYSAKTTPHSVADKAIEYFTDLDKNLASQGYSLTSKHYYLGRAILFNPATNRVKEEEVQTQDPGRFV